MTSWVYTTVVGPSGRVHFPPRAGITVSPSTVNDADFASYRPEVPSWPAASPQLGTAKTGVSPVRTAAFSSRDPVRRVGSRGAAADPARG
ncbi:hypothetical protein ACFCYB_38105 [Streptomyces sp. NPDC056309]|uniref:hypothetical protein n=1 Tax=Streptomyces sp. NPDC056309 TaxID=3345781 RepID=UPI0035DA9FEA